MSLSICRKISAHEFERGGLLKPIVNTIDGTPTFLSVDQIPNESQCLSTVQNGGAGGSSSSAGGLGVSGSGSGSGCGTASGSTAGMHCSGSNSGGSASTLGVGLTAAGRPQRLSRNELKQLDEKQLIFELVSYCRCCLSVSE